MKFYLLLSKRNLLIFIALLLIIFFIAGNIYSSKLSVLDGSTNAKRVNFIARLGYEIDENSVKTKDVTIPTDFGDVYNEYNKLQKKAGFDLYDYKGKTVKVFTYTLLYREDTELHLIVYEGRIIGGDIASVMLGGEMKPLLTLNGK